MLINRELHGVAFRCEQHFKFCEMFMRHIFGSSETLLVTDTYQFDEYSRHFRSCVVAYHPGFEEQFLHEISAGADFISARNAAHIYQYLDIAFESK